jgi:hypothetical protein
MNLKEKIAVYNDFLKDHFSENDLNVAEKRAELFKVDRDNLSDEVSNQPAISNYIGQMSAKAEAERIKSKIELRSVRGSAWINISRQRDVNTGKNLRIDDVKALIENDPLVLSSEAELAHAEKVLNAIKADEEASKQKYRMLELMGALVKQELYLKDNA